MHFGVESYHRNKNCGHNQNASRSLPLRQKCILYDLLEVDVHIISWLINTRTYALYFI